MTAANATYVSNNMPLSPRQRQLNQRVLVFVIAITVARSLAAILSPLELGVDEAQYWLWSQEFDFGYYTKPPLTSWIIGLSHGVFGHEVWAVRLPAAWLHLATALLLSRAAACFYGQSAGRWAAVLWILLPATSLASFVISTDTPLLLAWSGAVLALAAALTGRLPHRRGLMLAGVAIGVGMLAKYAAIYAVIGVALLVIWTRFSTKQKAIKGSDFALFIGMVLLAASPNLIWNLINDFTTVRHLGDNANLGLRSHDFSNVTHFIGAQFVVAGPVVFGLMILVLFSRNSDPARMLALCLGLRVLCVMMVQSYLSEANANWAITALPMLVVWLAGWLASPGGLRWGLLATAINGGIAIVFLMASMVGTFGALTPKSDPLRHLRGWQALADDIRATHAMTDAAVLVADRRATAALLSWHFHEQDVAIRVHDDDGIPSNHFEQNLDWQPISGQTVIALDGRPSPPPLANVIWESESVSSSHKISANRDRDLFIYRGTTQ